MNLEIGGVEKVVVDLASWPKNGVFRHSICCLDRFGAFAKEAQSRGVPVILVRRKAVIDDTMPSRLSKVFKEHKVDIVHSHKSVAMLYASLGAKLAGVRHVFNTVHDFQLNFKNMKNWALAWSFNTQVIIVSKAVRDAFMHKIGFRPGKVKVIYNGIDSNRFLVQADKKKFFQKLGIAKGEQVVGCVARFSPEKDLFTLLDAFALVCQQEKRVVLVLVGDGVENKELRKYAQVLGIKNQVIFTGSRKDIPDLMSIIDIFALSSISEAMSLVVLEAMAAGKPVVSTSVGGIPEAISDGKTGFLVPAKDSRAMARSILTLLRDKTLAVKMGQRGRQRAVRAFSFDTTAAKYKALYKKALLP